MEITCALDAFLREMDFPATKDDLLREAEREGLSYEERAGLRELPDQSFSARRDIRCLLAGHTDLVRSLAIAA